MNSFTLAEVYTKYLFFTGKGGVGKTSTAASIAVNLAETGRKVLIVSTDPASNLQDVFETTLSNDVGPVPSVPNLFAANLDPEEAARKYKERVIGPYRSMLPQSAVDTMEEQMSGACTVEVAAFDEFTQLLTDEEKTREFDHVIFDTAPTGHTLRLLQLPQAWSTFLDENVHGASCLGPVSGLTSKREQYKKAVAALADVQQTQLFLVARPDISSIREAVRAGNELASLEITNQHFIINGVFQRQSEDQAAKVFEAKQQKAFAQLPAETKLSSIPLMPFNLTGIEALRRFLENNHHEELQQTVYPGLEKELPGLDTVVEDLLQRQSGVFMTMGKGGVGKTTMAASVAASLARHGKKVHLTTTDPAAHVADALGDHLPETLTVSRIDPKKEVEAYKQYVLEKAGESLEAEELAFMEEDLDSPCTEEIAVFQAFAKVVEEAEGSYVVIDTAPTGHTLLLLDAAQSYHKEVQRATGEITSAVEKLLPRLRDPGHTLIALVTLPEATPVYEASRLQDDLRRAEIAPAWWLINQSFAASGTKDPLLLKRAEAENRWIHKVSQGEDKLAAKTALIPWEYEESKASQGLALVEK
ncbi:arsenical pump-driving ATPase [Alkalicoccus daliensis]|uniref:Arsenite efflux ATP-binding protein ArsA (TC 3.A.4.1.1) n=1 Tax=Alkalicoccus daliensis TaxID=745820 RepID=A0A1H0IS92_9BACI|nr:arsenical pump-driving ATPase [Alkalicoccus daliensis]SDO34192.1 arsenite efflux ATP-binding protein ArsA (TC 3.A.4.1.1) [Alkalicoccus daliensis]